jgi:hypothetical protein
MKKLRIDAIAFIIILGGLGILNFLETDKPTMSALENRMLKKKPAFSFEALWSGDYFIGLENYYSDTFLNRDNMVKVSRDIKDALSLGEPGVTLVVTRESGEAINKDDTDPGSEPPAAAAPNSDPTPTAPPSVGPVPSEGSSPSPSESTAVAPPSQEPTPTPTPEREFTEDEPVGYYLIVDGKAVQLFKFNREGMDYYAEVLNKYHEILGDDVTLYSMIPPTASEFLKLKKYKDITDSQNDAMDYLYSKLDDGIVTVNVYDALNRHKDEYIYFKTDHHWTARGAYYGYSALMESMGIESVGLDEYEMVKVENYLGSSYTKTLNKELEKNPDTIELFMPFTGYEYTMHEGSKTRTADILDMKYAEGQGDKYLIFCSTGGATWSVVKTDVKNGKKILVVKDSFGNAMVPFLLPHYEEIYIIDARFYNKAYTGMNITEFIRFYDIRDVVMLFYMEDVNWTKFMRGVEDLLN